MDRHSFEQLYVAEFKRSPLDDLADEYHRRCEAFDRTVCTGPLRDGGIMPATHREMRIISRHACEVRAEMRQRAAGEGFAAGEMDRAIRDAERRAGFR